MADLARRLQMVSRLCMSHSRLVWPLSSNPKGCADRYDLWNLL